LLSQERRKRQDEAARLLAVVPALTALRLELIGVQNDAVIPGSSHVKVIPLATAPALFELPCTDNRCKDGGHDLP
jgi:hypothetical protein